jgi:hypothetical protein
MLGAYLKGRDSAMPHAPARPTLLLAAALTLGGCAGASFTPDDSPWSIDAQVNACAGTRTEGFVLGDPGSLRQIPYVGPVAQSAQGALEAEAVCRVVRGFAPETVAAIKEAQLQAARSGAPVTQGGVAVTPRPVSDACVALASTHQASGMPLRSQLACRDARGQWRPAAL